MYYRVNTEITKVAIEAKLIGEISSHTHAGGGGLTLGETSQTAYRGDRGKTAYNHSQVTHAPSGAEVNVNADWNAGSGDAQILNKPSIPTALASLTDDATHRLVTDTEKSTWNGKSDLALGETAATAYRGDRGKTGYDHSQAAHAPVGAQVNADITKGEIEAKLTGEISTHTHAGGGGENEIIVLKTGSTANSTTTLVDCADLTFVATANKTYLIEAFLVWDASAATVGIKATLSASAAVTTLAGHFITDAAAGTPDSSTFNASDVVTTTSASAYTTNNMGKISAVLVNSSSANTIKVRFAAETTGTITIKAGSVLRYRLLN